MTLRTTLAALLALGFTGTSPAADSAPDLVIRHARIADGLGGPLFAGDVAIRDGRITAIGAVPARGVRELDARGLVLAPGFIDVHTHSENIDDLPAAENFLRMGVTTIVTGNCGGSKTRVGEFFRQLEQSNAAVNVATLVGHNTVRNQVMGGSFMRPPTTNELRQMRAVVDQAMRDGAVGLSTGLIYLPGTFAKTEEIVALAKVASSHGGIYVSHMRYETSRIFEALDELFTIAREANIHAEVSHLKLSGPNAWGNADRVLSALDHARSRGLSVTHDQYAYTASSTSLGQLIPSEAREGGEKRFLERLADPKKKAEIVGEMKNTLRNSQRSDYGYAAIASYRKNKELNGKTVPEAAKLVRGSDSLDDQIELLFDIQREGGASAVFHNMAEPDLQRFLQHPLTMFASDSGPRSFGDGVPHPRGYGNNARVLGRYVRELKLLTVEEAIRKMTSLPARTHRLGQRGELKPGFAADLVVFDPERVTDPATFDSPHHYAEGFVHVLVNGIPAIEDGKLTGRRTGLPVRRAPATTAL